MITLYGNMYLSIDERDVIDELNRLEEESNGISLCEQLLPTDATDAGTADATATEQRD
jgi:hypothetical protein